MVIRIYHNPRCSKSRATLALLVERGIEPEIIDYLNNPPNTMMLKQIQAALDCPAMDMVRTKEAPFKEAPLNKPCGKPTPLNMPPGKTMFGVSRWGHFLYKIQQ